MDRNRVRGISGGGLRIVLKALILIFLGSGAGVAYNALSGDGIPFRTPPYPTLPEQVNWSLYLSGMRVTLEEAKAAFDARSALFVDARNPGAYAAGHIPGAINISPYILRTRGKEALASVPHDARIITYCAGGGCQLSVTVGVRLKKELGYTHTGIFYGGWREWRKDGYPTKEGYGP